ncbi:MAG: hypothetical protein HKN05_09675, partial [Rhizobiales bacterium]|nr:hypothetical protein [Hyphomicrobiales bacterium]
MFYKVSADSVRLFDDHPPEGKEIPGFANLVFKGQEVTEISPSPDETWVKVWYKTEGANIIEGWIERANLEEAGTPERDKIVLWAFLKSCVRAEFAVNQLKDTKPYFVNADFLIALALYHGPNDTITNLGHKDPADLD